jgi:2-oxoglutarate/2-oxoacid ferredoxin oxidoreductase subunit alpha
VKECFEFAGAAFDLAEQLQTPIFVLSDLDLGMNNWMSEPFEYPDKPLEPRQGARVRRDRSDRLGGFARYKDVDGDGIPYRTLPGTDHPQGRLLHPRQRPQREGSLLRAARRLPEQHGAPRAQVRDRAHPRPQAEVVQTGRRSIGIIAFGTSDFAVVESRDQLKKEYGVEPTTSASAPILSAARCTTSSPRTSASTSSSRTATRRC